MLKLAAQQGVPHLVADAPVVPACLALTALGAHAELLHHAAGLRVLAPLFAQPHGLGAALSRSPPALAPLFRAALRAGRRGRTCGASIPHTAERIGNGAQRSHPQAGVNSNDLRLLFRPA